MTIFSNLQFLYILYIIELVEQNETFPYWRQTTATDIIRSNIVLIIKMISIITMYLVLFRHLHPVVWCSWLSHIVNTDEALGSSPSMMTKSFFFICFHFLLLSFISIFSFAYYLLLFITTLIIVLHI